VRPELYKVIHLSNFNHLFVTAMRLRVCIASAGQLGEVGHVSISAEAPLSICAFSQVGDGRGRLGITVPTLVRMLVWMRGALLG
jgi:hypothetical protein